MKRAKTCKKARKAAVPVDVAVSGCGEDDDHDSATVCQLESEYQTVVPAESMKFVLETSCLEWNGEHPEDCRINVEEAGAGIIRKEETKVNNETEKPKKRRRKCRLTMPHRRRVNKKAPIKQLP